MFKQLMAGLIVSGFVSGSALAATSSIEIDPSNTIAGHTAHKFLADGEGVDWTGAVLLIELTAGSVYNAPAFDGVSQQQAFWGLVAGLQWDSAVGIPGDGTGGIAGGAGDLGGPGGATSLGLLLSDAVPQLVSVTWFNTRTTDTGPVQIGNITLSDDAAGTWQMITAFEGGLLLQSDGTFPIPEPGALALLVLGGSGLLYRR